jgi:hypothetical protein
MWLDDGNGGRRAALDPERAPAIRKAFEKVASGKWTVQRAYLWLHYEANVYTRSGGSLTEKGFRDILSNRVYGYGPTPRCSSLVSKTVSRVARLIARA